MIFSNLICAKIVEREPMWDGNGRSRISFSLAGSLSENQCGMETLWFSLVNGLCSSLSENQCGMETAVPCAIGWHIGCVEREPMWDGNQMYPFTRQSRVRLSENQCGMETSNCILRDSLYFWLSENQCGMETSFISAFVFCSMRVEREPMWDGNT